MWLLQCYDVCCSYFSLCISAPLLGWLKDLTGSYVFSFVVASVFLFLGTIITMTLPYFCTCTNPLPLSLKKKTKNESTEADPLKQVLPVDSIENIQNPDRIPETLPSQNHLTETSLEVKDAPLSANWTGSEATCWLAGGAVWAPHRNHIDQLFFLLWKNSLLDSVYRETVNSR